MTPMLESAMKSGTVSPDADVALLQLFPRLAKALSGPMYLNS
jgi:hypothetical protein